MVIILVVASVYLLLRAPTAATPEATILTMKEAINARDADKLHSLFSSEVQKTMTKEDVKFWLKMIVDALEYSMDKVEFLEVSIKDNTATVRMSITITAKNLWGVKETKTTETTTTLVLEAGEWKLATPVLPTM